VRDADRIIVLEGGEVREVGTHEELLRRPRGLYSRLHELQFTQEGQAV
jgi:subfamily B ATP-binding cassette protein HlyB/CyaB